MIYLAKTFTFVMLSRGHIQVSIKFAHKCKETTRALDFMQSHITDGKNDL